MRRRAVLTSVLSSGVWCLGARALAQSSGRLTGADVRDLDAKKGPVGFTPWLQIDPAGRVTAFTTTSDLGQGTWTSLRAVVAEQLALPLQAVQVQHAPIAPKYFNRTIENYATFGSAGWRDGESTLGVAAAAAREMLVRAASHRWNVSVEDCSAFDAAVHHGERSLRYTELLADASALALPAAPRMIPRGEWRLLGTTRGELAPADAADRIEGRTVYGIDVRRPQMLFAAVRHSPSFGGHLMGVDTAPARSIVGVLRVLSLPSAVAVIARDTWTALRAAAALQPRWSGAPDGSWSSDGYRSDLIAAAQQGVGEGFGSDLDARLRAHETAMAMSRAAEVVDVCFDVPFLAHMPMEPLNATVQVTADRADVWVSTQSQLDTRRAVARALGLRDEQVLLHSMPAGGGFGRRLEQDWVVEAALIARAMPGQAIKTTWSREAELRAGFFRPAAAARVRVAVESDGGIAAIRTDLAQPSLLQYSGLTNGPKSDLDWTATMGWVGHAYDIPAMHLTVTRVDRGVPCGYWRSVGASQNSFFLECALDLVAHRSQQDPLVLRRRLLAKNSRYLSFIDQLAAAARWGELLPLGHARGIAIAGANGAISGHVVEVEVVRPGRFRLVRITAAIDAGVVSNPRAVEAQMMGGTVFGLGAALNGEITITAGRVDQANFDGYKVATMADVPPIQILVISGGEQSAGVGEEGVPTIAPAIANALLAASGHPVTRLPLSRSGWIVARPEDA